MDLHGIEVSSISTNTASSDIVLWFYGAMVTEYFFVSVRDYGHASTRSNCEKLSTNNRTQRGKVCEAYVELMGKIFLIFKFLLHDLELGSFKRVTYLL